MIKWIVSDLDGTLFEGHGETVFDLCPANEAALKALQRQGIEFCVASGRMIGYGIHLLENMGFAPSGPRDLTAPFVMIRDSSSSLIRCRSASFAKSSPSLTASFRNGL